AMPDAPRAQAGQRTGSQRASSFPLSPFSRFLPADLRRSVTPAQTGRKRRKGLLTLRRISCGLARLLHVSAFAWQSDPDRYFAFRWCPIMQRIQAVLALSILLAFAAAPARAQERMAQHAILYDEDPDKPRGQRYPGTVIWCLNQIKATDGSD